MCFLISWFKCIAIHLKILPFPTFSIWLPKSPFAYFSSDFYRFFIYLVNRTLSSLASRWPTKEISNPINFWGIIFNSELRVKRTLISTLYVVFPQCSTDGNLFPSPLLATFSKRSSPKNLFIFQDIIFKSEPWAKHIFRLFSHLYEVLRRCPNWGRLLWIRPFSEAAWCEIPLRRASFKNNLLVVLQIRVF